MSVGRSEQILEEGLARFDIAFTDPEAIRSGTASKDQASRHAARAFIRCLAEQSERARALRGGC